MTLKLPEDLRHALDENHGFIQGPSFAVMSTDVYRQVMGVGSDDEFQASVAALRKSLEEIKRGKSRPFTEFLDELQNPS